MIASSWASWLFRGDRGGRSDADARRLRCTRFNKSLRSRVTVVTPPQESHGDDAAMAERVRAAPRIPAPQQILEPEQTTVVSFTDDDEAPTPAQSPEQSYDALETNEAAQDAAQWRRRAADLERQVSFPRRGDGVELIRRHRRS